MSGRLATIKQLGQIVNPRTLLRLRRAGALTAGSPLAIGGVLPWLVGRGPSLGLLSQMNARTLGDKPAIIDRNGELTFAGLEARANRMAHALEELGLAGGGRVAWMLRNTREFAELALACQKVGAIGCPLNTWAKPKELESTLLSANPGALVYDVLHAGQLAALDLKGIPLFHVDGEGEPQARSRSYEELLASQPDRPVSPLARQRGVAALVIHTSGTTGTPKGALRDAAVTGLGALSTLLAVVPFHRDDIVYVPTPMFHSFGLITFTIATAIGATVVLPEDFDPLGTLQAIERHGATAVSLVPVMIRRITSLPERDLAAHDLSGLRIVLASGSAMSGELRSRAREVFGDVLYDLYGSTEIGWVAIATPEDMTRHPTTVGRPTPGVQIAVFSADGRRLPSGEIGELFIKSDILFEGYTSGETKDERAGYMTIGDLGRLDEEGYLFIEGRADDMVVVGGENVYPAEIEQLLEALPGVDEAAVLGVDDPEFGQVLVAFVAGGASADELMSVCRAQLASYKVPRRFEILDELPRTASGKVIKRALLGNP